MEEGLYDSEEEVQRRWREYDDEREVAENGKVRDGECFG